MMGQKLHRVFYTGEEFHHVVYELIKETDKMILLNFPKGDDGKRKEALRSKTLLGTKLFETKEEAIKMQRRLFEQEKYGTHKRLQTKEKALEEIE